MQLFCPSCQAAFSGASRCPRCGGLLLMPQEATPDESPRRRRESHEPICPTPLGRVIVGTLLALGLYLALRKLATGWLTATTGDPDAWWMSFEGLRTVLGLQAGAAVFGALIAGACRPRGFPLGAVVGGLCGSLFLAAELVGGAPPADLVILVQPAVLLAAGGIAGTIGSRVWPTAPDVEMPPPAAAISKLSSIQLETDPPAATRRPTAWFRVLVGALLMVAGAGLADQIRFGAQKYSGGLLKVESRGQGRFLSWQFATLVILGGGALAGAGTGAGIRHGIFAGVLGAAGVLGLSSAQGEIVIPAGYWLDKLHLGGLALLDPAAVTAVASGVILAGMVGGWLGATLFLPLAPPHMRNRRLRMGD
ncbi:MAG TPA: hypothetical protein VKE74_00050 [Gemmataceae bacterium]|nr:hypothetical protein [Gemmataceae bacterium]